VVYTPKPDKSKVLNDSLKFINSVPYPVTLRFIFYRWYQTTPGDKLSYENYKKLVGRARKNFWNGWNPGSIVDDTRNSILKGFPKPPKPEEPNMIQHLDSYIEIWFESRGMVNQFKYHTKDFYVTLVPFGGDPSINFKWTISRRLENVHKTYKKPIKILYFGDCDIKGNKIPRNALKDIFRWSTVPFDFIHCGLTLEQAKEVYKLPPKPDEPNQYQWESLEDHQAKELIQDNLSKHYKLRKGGRV
jgi:hypothetical protein